MNETNRKIRNENGDNVEMNVAVCRFIAMDVVECGLGNDEYAGSEF